LYNLQSFPLSIMFTTLFEGTIHLQEIFGFHLVWSLTTQKT
jgi:hypothetical protein